MITEHYDLIFFFQLNINGRLVSAEKDYLLILLYDAQDQGNILFFRRKIRIICCIKHSAYQLFSRAFGRQL